MDSSASKVIILKSPKVTTLTFRKYTCDLFSISEHAMKTCHSILLYNKRTNMLFKDNVHVLIGAIATVGKLIIDRLLLPHIGKWNTDALRRDSTRSTTISYVSRDSREKIH